MERRGFLTRLLFAPVAAAAAAVTGKEVEVEPEPARPGALTGNYSVTVSSGSVQSLPWQYTNTATMQTYVMDGSGEWREVFYP